jgi:molybdopterin adenylyltransferase
VFEAGILTISDKGWRGERIDESGPAAREYITHLNIKVTKCEIIPDEKELIATKLKEWVDNVGLDLIITSGGTGLSPRDVTPEATNLVIEKVVPGLVEAMRMETMKKAPTSILSRAVAGSRGKCLIVNLPGSPTGVRECMEIISPVLIHALETLAGKVFEGPHYSGK